MFGGAQAAGRIDDHVSVLVVEEHRLFAEGLRLLVEQDDRLRVIGVVTAVDEAIAHMREKAPDVILVGRCFGHRDALRRLGTARGEASLVVVGSTGDDALLARALEAGAAAVVEDGALGSDLVRAITRAGDGHTLFSPSVIADVIRRRATRVRRATPDDGTIRLTSRERQVLDLLADGCDSKEIATRLGLSVDTVRDYAQNVLEKLDAHSRIEALSHARRLGLIRQTA